MKAYVTKYALSKGIFTIEGDFYQGASGDRKYFSQTRTAGNTGLFLGPNEYALTPDDARKQAFDKCSARLRAIKKEEAKLKALNFTKQLEAL